MRAGQNHVRRGQAALCRKTGAQAAEIRARSDDSAEDVRRQVELPQEIPRPIPLERVVTLRGGRLGEFARLLACHQPVEKVGDQEHGLGHVQQRRSGKLHRQELKERIELHELQARVAKNLLPWDDGKCLLHHPVRAAVTIVAGVAEQRVVPSQESEIDPPGIYAHGDDCPAQAIAGNAHAIAHMGPESRKVPEETAGHFNPSVLKSVDFL